MSLPYIGPSRVPLPTAYELIDQELWTAPDDLPRDRSNDMTDEQIAAAIAGIPATGRADGRGDMA